MSVGFSSPEAFKQSFRFALKETNTNKPRGLGNQEEAISQAFSKQAKTWQDAMGNKCQTSESERKIQLHNNTSQPFTVKLLWSETVVNYLIGSLFGHF